MFDGFQIDQTRPNTIKHDQTRSSSSKQGVQTVNCFFAKQCLIVFGRQTFLVCRQAVSQQGYWSIYLSAQLQ